MDDRLKRDIERMLDELKRDKVFCNVLIIIVVAFFITITIIMYL